MEKKKDQPSNLTNFIIIGLIILSTYLLYSLTLAFYKSHQIDIYIEDFEKENQRIAQENRKLVEEFDYITSDAYIDKILKQNKGLVNPGEDMVVIASTPLLGEEKVAEEFENTSRNLDGVSNVNKWKIFIFDDNPLR